MQRIRRPKNRLISSQNKALPFNEPLIRYMFDVPWFIDEYYLTDCKNPFLLYFTVCHLRLLSGGRQDTKERISPLPWRFASALMFGYMER